MVAKRILISFSAPDMAEAVALSGNRQDMDRVLIVLEGESLVNDATALIVLGFALPARRRGALFLGSFQGNPISTTLRLRVARWGRLARGSPKASETDLLK